MVQNLYYVHNCSPYWVDTVRMLAGATHALKRKPPSLTFSGAHCGHELPHSLSLIYIKKSAASQTRARVQDTVHAHCSALTLVDTLDLRSHDMCWSYAFPP